MNCPDCPGFAAKIVGTKVERGFGADLILEIYECPKCHNEYHHIFSRGSTSNTRLAIPDITIDYDEIKGQTGPMPEMVKGKMTLGGSAVRTPQRETVLTINLNLDRSYATVDLLTALNVMADSFVPIQPSEIVDLLEQWRLDTSDELSDEP